MKHGGVKDTRRNGHDPDSVLRELTGNRKGHSRYTCL